MARLRFGIPDIELSRPGGGRINPSAFAGHPLVVVFCPSTPEAEASELADYRKYACELGRYDAWLLTVSGLADVPKHEPECPTATVYDRDGAAWTAFSGIAPPPLQLERMQGATFLFGRGGALQRVWPGRGHAAEVLDELARPLTDA